MSHSVAKASLELTMILLIQPFHCWDYRFKLLNLVKRILHNSLRTWALKDQSSELRENSQRDHDFYTLARKVSIFNAIPKSL